MCGKVALGQQNQAEKLEIDTIYFTHKKPQISKKYNSI